jgi:hypothetical protein
MTSSKPTIGLPDVNVVLTFIERPDDNHSDLHGASPCA